MRTYAHTTDYVTDIDSAHDEHARYVPSYLVIVDVRPDDAERCPECPTGIVETTGAVHPFDIRFACTDCGFRA